MAMDLVLRKNQFAIRFDIKDAAPARDERDRLDRVRLPNGRLEFADQSGRQTDGTRSVVSLHTKRDGKAHGPKFTGRLTAEGCFLGEVFRAYGQKSGRG